MDEIGYEHAALAQAAYDLHSDGLDAAQSNLRDAGYDYELDRDLSNDIGIVARKPNGEVVVAYRGTDPLQLSDLTADALIALGSNIAYGRPIPGSRFANAEHLFRQTKEKYGSVPVLTGHSLGGTLADYVGRRNEARSIAFNPGETPLEMLGTMVRAPSNTRVYVTPDDPISLGAQLRGNYDTVITVPRKGSFLSTHGLHNFLRMQDATATVVKTEEQKKGTVAPTRIRVVPMRPAPPPTVLRQEEEEVPVQPRTRLPLQRPAVPTGCLQLVRFGPRVQWVDGCGSSARVERTR